MNFNILVKYLVVLPSKEILAEFIENELKRL